MRRKLIPVAVGTAAIIMGAASAAMVPTAHSTTMDFFCEDDAKCAHLDSSEWCKMELLDTYCQYYPEDPQNPDPDKGTCNTWSSGSCPFN